MLISPKIDLEENQANQHVVAFDRLSLDKNIYQYIWLPDQQKIYDMLKSVSWSKDPKAKKKEIDNILSKYWFKRLGCGTNRLVYECSYDPRIVLKVPFEESGLPDAGNEMTNQQYLKPFICKTFDVGFLGVASLHERVIPIMYREQFLLVSNMHYDMMNTFFHRGILLDDMGTRTFRNFGIRDGFGLVSLDYPNVFKYNETAGGLRCRACGGRISPDVGFNRIACKSCKKVYTAQALAANLNKRNGIIISRQDGGKETMAFQIINGETGKVIMETETVKETKKFDKKPRMARNPFLSKVKPMDVEVRLPEGTLIQKDPVAIKGKRTPGQKYYNTNQVVYKKPEVLDGPPKEEEENKTDSFVNIPLPNGTVSSEELNDATKDLSVDEEPEQDVNDYPPMYNEEKERVRNKRKHKFNKKHNYSINKNDF